MRHLKLEYSSYLSMTNYFFLQSNFMALLLSFSDSLLDDIEKRQLETSLGVEEAVVLVILVLRVEGKNGERKEKHGIWMEYWRQDQRRDQYPLVPWHLPFL